MARIKSTARLTDGTVGSRTEDRGIEGLVDRMESVASRDAGSHNGARCGTDDGSHVRSYFFGPSTMRVSRIYGMIDCHT
jgi:hypothetical protein